ncbi:unnamed protein product [Dicrocoelium dendriticum]|nr:unnamed protein product [Dicrocoelium dendriticum]
MSMWPALQCPSSLARVSLCYNNPPRQLAFSMPGKWNGNQSPASCHPQTIQFRWAFQLTVQCAYGAFLFPLRRRPVRSSSDDEDAARLTKPKRPAAAAYARAPTSLFSGISPLRPGPSTGNRKYRVHRPLLNSNRVVDSDPKRTKDEYMMIRNNKTHRRVPTRVRSPTT